MSGVREERLLEKGVTEGVRAMHISVSPPLLQVRCWYFRSSATLLYASLGDEGGEGVLTWLESHATLYHMPVGLALSIQLQALWEEAVPCTHIHTHAHIHAHTCIHVPHMHMCTHICILTTSHPYWLESVTCPM